MEKYRYIIATGKVSASDFGYNFMAWGSNILMILVSIWGFYYINTSWITDEEPNKIILGNIAMIFIAVFSLYILILTRKKLKIKFYKDNRAIEKKHQIIQHLKNENHWRLEKEEINYYLFFENNILIPSYYITIVIDESGFYLNCFPYKSRVLDFGRSNRWCNELFESMKKVCVCFFLVLLTDTSVMECGVFRNKQRNNNLFQDIRVLRLNCDNTFSYKHSNCINPDTSFGAWTQIGNSIVLTTPGKLKKLVKKEIQTSSGYAFVDLDNETMIIIDSFVIWKRSDKGWIDTLYRQ